MSFDNKIQSSDFTKINFDKENEKRINANYFMSMMGFKTGNYFEGTKNLCKNQPGSK